MIRIRSAIQMNVTSTISHILQWSSPIKFVPYDKNQTVYQLHASHFFCMFHRFNKLPIMKQSTISNTHNNNDETRMDDSLVPSNKEAPFSLFRTLIRQSLFQRELRALQHPDRKIPGLISYPFLLSAKLGR